MIPGLLERKYCRLLQLLIGSLATLVVVPVVLIVRILRPLVQIRFGYFTADRIGHFSFDVEYYLTEKHCDKDKKSTKDFFFFKGKPANIHFAEMCRRSMVVHPAVKWLYRANEIVPWGSSHGLMPARVNSGSRDLKGLFGKVGPQLGFNGEENMSGEEYLQQIGMKNGDRYICLVARDRAYLERTYEERDWSYHDFRDTKIESYEAAAIALAEKGYWVFRMGKVVHSRFSIEHPRVVDYATSTYRSDNLDIWLMAHSYFTISTGLGLDSIADIFRRPIVFVNYLPILDLEAWGRFITVPKSLFWASNCEPLTLQDQLKHTSLNGHYYEEKGIQVRDLNPSEITEPVLEMEARLSGSWVETIEDIELQERFWQEICRWPNFSKFHGWIHPEAKLGSHYLRRYKHCLIR